MTPGHQDWMGGSGGRRKLTEAHIDRNVGYVVMIELKRAMWSEEVVQALHNIRAAAHANLGGYPPAKLVHFTFVMGSAPLRTM